MKLAPNTPLLSSSTRLKLYSGDLLSSMGIFETECVVKGRPHQLAFEVVKTNQKPLLSVSTCERLGLIMFMVPADVHAIELTHPRALTKEQLIRKYEDVFNSPVESVPGEVHFELDPTIAPVQCAPRNVPIAMKTDVKALLDEYQADGHITDVTDPTEWISNMVVVKKPDKLRICLDPKYLNKALKRSHYIMPTLEDVLYKLPKQESSPWWMPGMLSYSAGWTKRAASRPLSGCPGAGSVGSSCLLGYLWPLRSINVSNMSSLLG